MKHYLCEIIETGEYILVSANTKGAAVQRMAEEYGMEVKAYYNMTEWEAEASGLDEY